MAVAPRPKQLSWRLALKLARREMQGGPDGRAFAGNKKLVRGELAKKITTDLDSGKGLQV